MGFYVFGFKDAFSNRSFVTDDSDSWFAWIRWWCYLAIAIIVAAIWSRYDRSRRHDDRIHAFLRVYIRYALVVAMFEYGFVKAFLEQFPNNELDWIFRRWVDVSPFMLLWGALGYSQVYQAFAGLTELAGGILLLFRRTTTLGALVTAAVMTNGVMLDLCFDVPVKLNALNLLGFAIFLTYPDWKGLANFFILNRPAAAVRTFPLWTGIRMRRIAVASQILFVGLLLYRTAFADRSWSLHSEPICELYGWYKAEAFTLNDVLLPPLQGDTNRWLSAMITKKGRFGALRMDDNPAFDYLPSRVTYTSADLDHGTITIKPKSKSANGAAAQLPQPIVWAYTKPGPDLLRLEGTNDGTVISVLLRRVDHENMPLLKQKFRWVGR